MTASHVALDSRDVPDDRSDALADTVAASDTESDFDVPTVDVPTVDVPTVGDRGAPPEGGELTPVDPEHYELLGELARGGMGVVLRARDRRVGREVALKQLLTQQPKQRRRFVREARITGQLQHPSIVPVYEVGSWPDGSPFYAMKLVGGRPLDALIDEAADDDARLALIPRLVPAVEAIAYAHDRGVIHRDLKPANVLLGEFGETIVIDWGLARGIDEPDVPSPEGSDEDEPPTRSSGSDVEAVKSGGRLTAVGAVIGTPAYMAPEQARGARVDARTDVYALGALLYHALSGQPPHERETMRATVMAVVLEPPTPLSALVPDAPADLIGIVEKAMARDPRDRYPDARALARDLEAFSTGRLVGAYLYTSWELVTRFVRRNRALSATLTALLVVAIAGSVAIVGANRTSERERQRAVAAERLAAQQERVTHERLAQVHWRAAVRHLQAGDHLAAEVLAAGALLEQPANPTSPYHALPTDAPLSDQQRAARLAGPSATWSAAHALRFASPTRELAGHDDWLYDVLPSPDGRWVITTAADHRALVWDAADGALRHTLEGHDGNVFQAAIDAEGDRLATSGYDGTIRIWSLRDGAALRTIRHPDDRVYGICFAADGTLQAAGASGRIASFDAGSGELLGVFDVTTRIPWRLDCPPDENIAVLGTNGPEALVIDLTTHEVVLRLSHPDTAVQSALLSADRRSVITADARGVVRRFDRTSGERTARTQLSGGIEALARSPDGRWVAAGGELITILDGATLRPVARLDGHASTVAALAFDPASRRLYSGSTDHRVIEWEITPAREGLTLLAPTDSPIDCAQVSPNGRRLVTGGDDRAVRVWDLETGAPLAAWHGHTAPVRGVLFLDDDLVASSGMDRALWLHRLSTGESRRVSQLPHFGDELARAGDGQRIAIGSGDGSVVLHDLESGERRVLEGVHEGRTWWIGLDPEGGRLATASFAGTIAIVDPNLGRVVRRWQGHDGRVYAAGWRPDGAELTTADLDGWVRGWDPDTGERVRQWRSVDGEPVRSIAWSPDGRWLLLTTDVGMRVHQADGTLVARLDLAARASIAAWTADGRMIFASAGRIFVLPLDTTSWREDPEDLLAEAERTSGATLNVLIGLEP